MNKPTLIPADDVAGCPFHFFDDIPKEQYYKVYNDGGHYVAIPYFHSYGQRKSQESPLERVFTVLYNEALKKHGSKEQLRKRREKDYDKKPLNLWKFINEVTPVLRARFPQENVTKRTVARLIRVKRDKMKPEIKVSKRSALDVAFDGIYKQALENGFEDEALVDNVKAGLLKLFPERTDLDGYIVDKLEKQKRNVYARKKRFRRKASLNRWNYFVTVTYDDEKQTEETFRKKLRKCLSNLSTRRGWKYMGVFERAPETGRLHFHGLVYVPHGQMVGEITEKQDYSTRLGRMQTTHSNGFFENGFGRNDFEELNAMELKHGQTLNYILKYIGKTGERIVYSRGIPTQVFKKIEEKDIVTRMQDYMQKYLLFDDSIKWERDVLHYTHYKQMTIIDLLCNPPQVA